MSRKKTILLFEEDHKTLKQLSSEQGRSMLSLAQEAISLLVQKYKPIKETIAYERPKERVQ